MRNAFLFPTLFVVVATLTGCHSVQKNYHHMSMSMKSSLNMIPVMQCTALWNSGINQDTVNGKDPERGFAGKAYFYGSDSRYPVRIKDGHVAVYVFDEEDRSVDDHVPDRCFVFTPEELNGPEVYSKSNLGHSYNLWIPWDSEGPNGQAKKMSLIVKYIPPKGSSVVSQQAVAYLPGKMGGYQIANKADWDNVERIREDIRQVGQSRSDRNRRRNDGRMIDQPDRPQRMQTTTLAIGGTPGNTSTLPQVVASTTTLAPTLRTGESANGYGQLYGQAQGQQPQGPIPRNNGVVPASYQAMSYPMPNYSATTPETTVPTAAWGPDAETGTGYSAYSYYPQQVAPIPTPQQYGLGLPEPPVPAEQAAPSTAAPWASSPPLQDSRSTQPYSEPIRR